jgi:hypothetical protein
MTGSLQRASDAGWRAWRGVAPGLRWLLLVTGGLSLVSLALPGPDPLAEPVPRPAGVGPGQVSAPANVQPMAIDNRAAVAGAWGQLMTTRRRVAWAPAAGDPFAAAAAATSMAMAAPPPAVALPGGVFTGPPAPEPPAPPPQTLFQVTGWLRATSGQVHVLLSNGQLEWVARPGLALGDGFVVEAWGSGGLELLHLPTGTRQTLALPSNLPPLLPAGSQALGAGLGPPQRQLPPLRSEP